MESSPAIVYGLALFTLVYLWRWLVPSKRRLSHIPTVGPSAPLLSFWGTYQWLFNCRELIRRGNQKYKGRLFKVATMNGWQVFVTGTKLIDELRRADELSFYESGNANLEFEYTAGPNVARNWYHSTVLRNELSKSLPLLFPEIKDECAAAFNDYVPSAQDWISVGAYDMIAQIVARISNRIFVGLPFCRDPEYTKLSIQYTVDLMTAALIIRQFPAPLKRFAARFLTRVDSSIDTGMKCMGEEVERRLRLVEQHGPNYPDKPFDVLSWLIDYAEGEERTPRNLVLRLLVLSFSSIHTSSMVLTNALYQVAAHPEYAAVLREEAESVLKHEGWSKATVDKMHKMDSLFKECLRTYSIASVGLGRIATKDFAFSDGTFIPKGTMLASPALEVQQDPEFWEDGHFFNPWRFSDAREREGDSSKHDFVSTSLEMHSFGHGRHACPGRVFSAVELKTFLAHVVLNFDVKAEHEGVVPPPFQFTSAIMPNQTAKVFLRKRR